MSNEPDAFDKEVARLRVELAAVADKLREHCDSVVIIDAIPLFWGAD